MKHKRDIRFHYAVYFYYPALSAFHKDQNKECPLKKFEQFKSACNLEKFLVNLDAWIKWCIAFMGRGNLIFVFWKCLTYQNVQRIKFAELEKTRKWTRRNQTTAIFFGIEQTFSLKDSLWIILAESMDIFNKTNT